MKRLFASLYATLLFVSVATAQRYDTAWFKLDSVATSTTYSAQTSGRYTGKIISVGIVSDSSNACVGLYSTNPFTGGFKAILADVTNEAVAGSGVITNLAAVEYIAEEMLVFRAKLHNTTISNLGSIKSYVIIEE